MAYRFRKPELVPTLFMLCAVSLMFSLSVWQLKRLEWKNALLASIEDAQNHAPKDLRSYTSNDLSQHEWYNVFVTGHFLNDKELHATPRYLNEKMGYAILTPLAVNTSSGIEYVLINRGWVPPEQKEATARSAGNPTGEVRIEGIIRKTLPQGSFRPDNKPEKNLWFWYDIPAMSQQTGLKFLPVLIDATRVTIQDGSAVKSGPTPFPVEINIRNDHLGYAITWFLIGLSGIVMYVVYYTEKKN